MNYKEIINKEVNVYKESVLESLNFLKENFPIYLEKNVLENILEGEIILQNFSIEVVYFDKNLNTLLDFLEEKTDIKNNKEEYNIYNTVLTIQRSFSKAINDISHKLAVIRG